MQKLHVEDNYREIPGLHGLVSQWHGTTLTNLTTPMKTHKKRFKKSVKYEPMCDLFKQSAVKIKHKQPISSAQAGVLDQDCLLSRHCHKGDIDGAGEVLKMMKVMVDENIFNTLISGHGDARDLARSYGMLKVMKQWGLILSRENYLTLACDFAKYGEWHNVEKVMAESQAKGLGFKDGDYLELVYIFSEGGHNEHIGKLLALTPHETEQFSIMTSHLVVRLVNSGHDDVAYNLVQYTVDQSCEVEGREVCSEFLEQMVRVGRHVTKLILMVRDVTEKKLFTGSLNMLVDIALRYNNISLSTKRAETLVLEGGNISEKKFADLLNLAHQGQMNPTCPKLKTVNYVTTPKKSCTKELCLPVRSYDVKTLRKVLLRASLNQSTSEKKKTHSNSDKKLKITSTDRKLSVSEMRCKQKFSRTSAQKTALHNVSYSTDLEGDTDCEIKLEQLKIYRGKVQNIKIFGCFVQLLGFRSKVLGLVHISQLRREGKVANVEEVVARGDTVWVKVLFNKGRKTSLSMKDVDQTTGEDLNPSANNVVRNSLEEDIRMMHPERPVDLMDILPARVVLVLDEDELKTKNEETIISSSVKCDLEQMIKANVIDKSELPDFDEQTGLMHKVKVVVVLEMVPLT